MDIKVLYLSLVRRLFPFASQVRSPQTVSNIVKIEKVQRRATKFILSLPYKTHISYKKRPQYTHNSLGLLLARIFGHGIYLQMLGTHFNTICRTFQ